MPVKRLFFEGKEIVLVGTAHISDESAMLVRQTVEQEKPDVVGVELDVARFNQLRDGVKWQQMDINQVIATGQAYLLLVNLLLANVQRQLGEKVGVKPGLEMMEAINICAQQGLLVKLLDRDVGITLKRAVSQMGFFEKLKFGYFLLLSAFGFGQDQISKEKIEELKQSDVMSQLMQELGKEFPSVKKVLVDERDEFIANRIMEIVNTPGSIICFDGDMVQNPAIKKIVCVLGAGHLEGVEKHIGKRTDNSVLEVVPKKKNVLGLVSLVVPALFVVLLGYVFLTRGIGPTFAFLGLWFVVVGSLSALGVVLVRGHIFSVLTAFVAAPFTTLHPLLAAGWFAGYVEAKFNAPKVIDFESLRNISLSDFPKNSVTRILLVVVGANLGATIGVVVAFPAILAIIS